MALDRECCGNKGEKMNNNKNPVRISWYRVYLAVGFLFLVLFYNLLDGANLLDIAKGYIPQILWCLSWAAFGIGLGLWNSNTASEKNQQIHMHYYTYFIFVWLIATLLAFLALGTFDNDIIRSYVAAALAGLVVGFIGDNLPERLGLPKY